MPSDRSCTARQRLVRANRPDRCPDDRQSGRRVYGSWPGTDPKAAIIWEAFKPESEPRRTIREDEIKPIKTPKRSNGPAQKGSSGRTDTDFLDDRGGII